MSKNFEKEYKEYLNSQAPDLWNRIEAGVDALDSGLSATERPRGAEAEKIVPISDGKSKKAKKKRQVRYQNYRALVSVAACLFALIIIVPVYLFTRPTGKDSATNDSAPQVLEDVTIQNLVVDSAESETAAEEAAPMEEIEDGVTEVEIALEESVEEIKEVAQVTEENSSGTETEETTTLAAGGESGGQVASSDSSVETEGLDMLSEVAGKDSVSMQQMQVTILGAGEIQEDGVMYSATVIGSTESTTVELLVPVSSDIVLEAEKAYTLTVQMAKGDVYYIVVGATAME